MKLEIFINNFAKQFADADVQNIKENTKFRELDTWDSLTGMAILMMIQDDYETIITVDEFKTLNTPKEIYEYLKNK